MRQSTPKNRLLSLLQPKNTPQKPIGQIQSSLLKEDITFKNSLRDMLKDVHISKMQEINSKKENDPQEYSLGKRTPLKSDL